MGGLIGDGVASLLAGAIDSIMKAIWSAAVFLLRAAFGLVDSLTTFEVAGPDGQPAATSPIVTIWPTLRWISFAVALGLFFWQLTLAMVRGGRGMWRVAAGPAAYGIAMAITVGAVGLLLAASDGITAVLLHQGLSSDTFAGILDNPTLAGGIGSSTPPSGWEVAGATVDATTSAVLLALIAIFALIPASIGFFLEMLFRQAAILVLVATVPLTAAGLLTNSTSSWFWRCLRWILAAVLMKPALVLLLVLGVNMVGAPTGFIGLLIGVGVLLVALVAPFTLYRLLAFVDPNTNAGAATRAWIQPSSLVPGFGGGSAGGGGDVASISEANVARFDAAAASSSSGSAAAPAAAGSSAGAGAATGSAAGAGAAGGAAAAAGPAGLAVLAAQKAGAAVQAVNNAVPNLANAAADYAGTHMDAAGIGHPGHGGGRPSGAGGGDHGGGAPVPEPPAPALAPLEPVPDPEPVTVSVGRADI